MSQLLIVLIPLLAQYGPELVKQVVDLIHGTPQQQGETDDAYVERLKQDSLARLADAKAKDAAVEAP